MEDYLTRLEAVAEAAAAFRTADTAIGDYLVAVDLAERAGSAAAELALDDARERAHDRLTAAFDAALDALDDYRALRSSAVDEKG